MHLHSCGFRADTSYDSDPRARWAGQELGRIGGLPVAKYIAIVLCRPVHVEGAHVTCPRCIRMHKNGADQI